MALQVEWRPTLIRRLVVKRERRRSRDVAFPVACDATRQQSANSAETSKRSFVPDELEASDSAPNSLGLVSGHCAVGVSAKSRCGLHWRTAGLTTNDRFGNIRHDGTECVASRWVQYQGLIVEAHTKQHWLIRDG